MEHLAGVPSLPSSLYYVYRDTEQYLSESPSPSSSTFDMASAADISSFSSTQPSPRCEDVVSPQQTQGQKKPAAKRKRENRYKNAPPAVLSRRRAQNRASQRAYRERKDQRIRDLEQMLSEAKQCNDALSQAYAALHAEYVALKASQALGDQHGYPHLQPLELLMHGGGAVSLGLSSSSTCAVADGSETGLLHAYAPLNAGYSC